MSANAVLYRLRTDKGLTLRQLAHETHLFHPLLYLYEQGYFPLSAKYKTTLAAYYGVETAVFDDPLGYPTPLFPPKKESPLKKKLSAFLFSGWNLGIVSTLLAVCLTLVGVGGSLVIRSQKFGSTYFEADYNALVSYVIAHGEANKESDGEESRDLSYSQADGSSFAISASADKEDPSNTLFNVSLPSEKGSYTFAYEEGLGHMWFVFGDVADGTLAYTGYGHIAEDNAYSLTVLLDVDGLTVADETLKAEEEAKLQGQPSKIENLYEAWLKTTDLQVTASFHGLLRDQQKGTALKSEKADQGNAMMLWPSLLGMVLFFWTLVVIVGLVKKKKKLARVDLEARPLEEALPLRNPEKAKAPLPHNWRFGPFLPETLLRLTGIGLMLASSIMLFAFIYPVVLKGDFLSLFSTLPAALEWYQYMPWILVGTLLWFFVRLEIMASEHYNLWPNALMFFALGWVYYVGEMLLSFYLSQTSSLYYGALFKVFTIVMPGNLFWGLTAFALITIFLLTTPQFKNPKNVIWWRLLTILPVAYLTLSYFYNVGIKLWEWPQWPTWAANLLLRKQFATVVFAIFYPLSLYVYKVLVVHRLGKENAELYFHGNCHYWTKNLLACFWIAMIVLANWVGQTTDFARALDLNKSYWLAILIPIILFYHPHMGKRSAVLDGAITAFYTIAMSFSYVFIAEFLLFEVTKMF